MHAYVLIPLVSCVVSATLVVVVLARAPRHRANRVAAVLVACGALWAFCEVVWNTVADPTTALWIVRLSSFAWVGIGPLALQLFLEVTNSAAPRLRRSLPWLYAFSAVFLVLDVATPWVHPRVMRASWGWAYELGPVYLLFFAFTFGCLLTGIGIAARVFRTSPSSGERSQARLLVAATTVPLTVASLTDGLLPTLGVQVPRLGTASFALLGAAIAWSFYRDGYSLFAPGDFAREIVETLPDGVALIGLDGRLRTANGRLALLLDAPPEALEGRRISELLSTAPLDPPREVDGVECELRAGPVATMPVAISSMLLRDKRAQPIGLVLVVRDLREVVSLRSRLVTSGRLAAVGQLAAGVAHEINNPMAFVRANLSLLRTHWKRVTDALGERSRAGAGLRQTIEEGEELIEESLEGVERTAAFVRDIQSFSHAGEGHRELVHLAGVLDGVLRVARSQLGPGVRVTRRYGEVPPVSAAPQELKQVFLNLVVNAAHAVGDKGRIDLFTYADGDFVVVEIEDDGCGIDPEVAPRIFDPFFTTRPVGDGTGLGLAISFQILRGHGGDIEVESTPGRGSRFSVRLPIGDTAAAQTGDSSPASRTPTR